MLRYAKLGSSLFLLLGITSSIGAYLRGNSPYESLSLAVGMLGVLIVLNAKDRR
jgi:hypothetical protein